MDSARLQSAPSTTARSGEWPAPGSGVEYHAVFSRAILERDQGRFYWTINPYRGCEFGCAYCLARDTPEAMSAPFRDFERKLGILANAVDSFAQWSHEDLAGRPIALGTLTDPWQPAERRFRLTRGILNAMVDMDGLDLRASTKSSLVTRDTDLLLAIGKRGRVHVSFSIATLDRRVAKALEPAAPTPDHRFVAMEAMARAGLRVGLVAMPLIPGLTDATRSLENLLRRARDAGATYACAGYLQPGPWRDRFFADLRESGSADLAKFHRLLRSPHHDDYAQAALIGQFEELRERFGLDPFEPENVGLTGVPSGKQLSLF
jgi:DNA repair photolyase